MTLKFMLRVTRGHWKWHPSTDGMWVPNGVPQQQSCINSQTKQDRRTGWKSFFPSYLHSIPPLEYRQNIWYRKIRTMWLRDDDKSLRIHSLVSIQYMNVKDERKPHGGIGCTMHSIVRQKWMALLPVITISEGATVQGGRIKFYGHLSTSIFFLCHKSAWLNHTVNIQLDPASYRNFIKTH